MQTQPNFVDFARTVFTRSVAPLGANRAQAYLRAGLPSAFRPALDFLFSGKLESDDAAAVKRVEALRQTFASGSQTFHVFDLNQSRLERSAQNIAWTASVTPQWGTFLYLCAKGFRASTMLELGSCAGISTSYLASNPYCQKFISIERSTELASVAQNHVRQILPGAKVVNASIDDVLEQTLELYSGGLELYYVDAFHQYAPTLRFMERAVPHLAPGALVIFDDIHWSKAMWQAWGMLRAQTGFSHTIDVGRFGLCVWQGGTVQPKQYNLAKYAGWIWDYTSRDYSKINSKPHSAG